MIESNAGMNSAVLMIPLQVNQCGAVMVVAKKLAVSLLPVGAFVRLPFRLSAGALLAGRADVVGQDVMLLASALPDHIISLGAAAPPPLPKQLVVVGVSSKNNQVKFRIETSDK